MQILAGGFPHKLLCNSAAAEGGISSIWQPLEEEKLLSGHMSPTAVMPPSLSSIPPPALHLSLSYAYVMSCLSEPTQVKHK